MNDARNRRIERFQRLLDDDKVYEARRESLALRPPPRELIEHVVDVVFVVPVPGS
jgi:hypothetical protein